MTLGDVRSSLVSLWSDEESTGQGSFLCSGVLVGPGQILTVKHVFEGHSSDKVWIRPQADATQAYPILGEVCLHPGLDVALLRIENMPPGAVALALVLGASFDESDGAYVLNGYFEGRAEMGKRLTVLNLDAPARWYITSPRHPKGHSGSAVCQAGKLWGVAVEHYDSPTVDRGCVIAVHQFWRDWLQPLIDVPADGRRANLPLTTPEIEMWLQNSSPGSSVAVVAPHPSGQGVAPIMLDDVYVSRTIESEIYKWLDRPESVDDGVIIAVVAPGGFGKTSLLWHCHQTIDAREGWESFFCTASQLISYIELGSFGANLAILAEYVRSCTRAGARIVVSVDTFDVLVHRQDLRAAVLSLVERLVDAGASVLVSSRPEEIAEVPLERMATSVIRLFLQEYDEQEFPKAVESHCRAFYRGSSHSPADVEEQIHRLRNAVALGRPVTEVCLNPLTLRMLFELYAPSAIPEDLNSFGLYSEYWVGKVIGDNRAGSPERRQYSQDLSHAVEFLALQMLAIGVPSLSKSQTTQHVAARRLTEEDISELVNRNLLTRSDTGALEFFHQTFFEHAAARAITRDEHEGSIAGCAAKLREKPNDAYRLPVYEQALLLHAESTTSDQHELEVEVQRLLADPHPGLLGVGLHIHMCSSTGLSCASAFLIDAAKRQERTVLRRFSRLIYNLRRTRMKEVIEVLEAAWQSREWDLLEVSTHQFLWLAQNDWQACERLIDKFTLLPTLYSVAPSSVLVERIVVSIIRHGLRASPTWVFDTVSQCVRSGRYHQVVLEFIIENLAELSILGAKKLGAFCQSLLATPLHGIDDGQKAAVTECLAAIWNQFPELGPTTVVELDNFQQDSRVLALSAVARNRHIGNEQLQDELIGQLSKFQDPGGFYMRLHYFLLPFLLSTAGDDSPRTQKVRRACASLAVRVFAVGSEPRSEMPLECRVVLSNFLRRVYVLGVSVPGIWDPLHAVTAEEWLTSYPLGNLFPVGLAEGVPSAQRAFNEICRSPAEHEPLVSLVGGVFQQLDRTPKRVTVLVRLVSATGDAQVCYSFFRLINRGGPSVAIAQVLTDLQPDLIHLVTTSQSSPKSTQRAAGHRLHALLVDSKLLPSPTLRQAIAWISDEGQLSCKFAALPLLVQASEGKSAESAVEMLLELSKEVPPTKLLPILVSMRALLAAQNGTLSISLIRQLVAFGTMPGSTEPQASVIGRVIDHCCNTRQLDEADAAALSLLRCDAVRSFSAAQKRTMAHRLDKPFQTLYKLLLPDALQVHCELLNGMDRYLGRLVVVAICKSGRTDLPTHLNRVLEQVNVHDEVKKIIQDFRQHLWKRVDL